MLLQELSVVNWDMLEQQEKALQKAELQAYSVLPRASRKEEAWG